MVTFSIPGDGDAADAGRSTPRPRPALPFAKRAYVPSPGAPKRFGTPQSVPTRKHLLSRDALPASSLNRSQIASNRNIFRQSSITSPPSAPFSPSLPQSTMTKVFAPGATPEPSRVYRESTAQATPRGMVSRATDKELFKMRIEDPDPELSGEVLTNKVPKEWNSKGSIYADQFLKHLCPPDFDDEQRRQFFCILDLRRLKYAANDIFSRKDWKLNVINFAKEFEKSRSIILLRYGLYEFQNVKPSKDVLKRWRREHGLPEPEEEEAEPTPTKKSITKKRKADEDDLPKESGLATNKNKRRAADRDEEEEEEVPAPAPAPSKNKRKASVSDGIESQPSKLQKSTSSNSLSLFEKIVNKSSTPVGSPLKNFTKPAEESTTPKPNPFAANSKLNAPGLSRSVFLKPAGAQAGGNIFGYLSDASSAKNSAADTDGEGTDSDAEESEEPSAVASAAETASQVDSNVAFGTQAATTNAVGGESSAPGTRESTPGRSLFDRVTKDSTGQPVRQGEKTEEDAPEKPAAKPVDQTWNPSSTPLKFAPTTSAPQSTSLFGNSTSAPSSNIFGAKPSTSSNLFGAKQDKPAEKESSVDTTVSLKDKSGSESDKENENDEAPKKSLFETKAPALQTNTSALNPLKPSAEVPKAAEPAKLFGAPKPEDKPAESTEIKANGKPAEPAKSLFGTSTAVDKPALSAPASTNLFASASKPAESSTPVLQSSTLFGGKPAEAPKAPNSLFGTSSTPASGTTTPATSTNIFGAKPATTTATSSLFGSSTPAAKPLFGASSSDTPKTDAAPAASTSFSFGSNGTTQAPKPMFAAPKSPSSSTPMFDGSPMKQDGPSPAKRAFNGGSTNATASAPPIFGFGNTSSTSAAPIFGGASAAPTNGTPSFGAGSASNNASGGASFSFGSTGSSFNNPFSSGNNVGSAAAGSNSNSGGMFNFGGAPAPSTSSPFQFGGGSGTSAPAFGANSTSTPAFGGASGSGSTPSFSFGASSQPATSGPTFGTQAAPNMFNLQPPAGGASTGTNTPFSLGGGSSLATTPAGGTPEPSTSAQATTTKGTEEEGEKHEQINLTDGLEKDEEILHDVRAKVLKFVSASEKSEKSDEKKKKSPWTTQGVGPLRLLKHKETGAVRLLMRAEPRGNVALNRSVLPNMEYKADEKYVKLTTSNEAGDGLETWMIQVKTKDLAKGLAESLEKHKELNKKK